MRLMCHLHTFKKQINDNRKKSPWKRGSPTFKKGFVNKGGSAKKGDYFLIWNCDITTHQIFADEFASTTIIPVNHVVFTITLGMSYWIRGSIYSAVGLPSFQAFFETVLFACKGSYRKLRISVTTIVYTISLYPVASFCWI